MLQVLTYDTSYQDFCSRTIFIFHLIGRIPLGKHTGTSRAPCTASPPLRSYAHLPGAWRQSTTESKMVLAAVALLPHACFAASPLFVQLGLWYLIFSRSLQSSNTYEVYTLFQTQKFNKCVGLTYPPCCESSKKETPYGWKHQNEELDGNCL